MNEAKEKFMNYMKEEFIDVPWENPFVRSMVENIVDYAYDKYGHSKGMAKYMIADIIPEISKDEIDDILPDFKS
ncbi:MAG: hypothetical protein J5929_01930 [Eubacterium sp.]|nr:hypothetical protein [Eubacterium sp.]